MMRTALTALVAVLLLAGTNAYAATILPPGATWEYTFTDPTGDPAWNTTTGGWQTGPAPFGNCTRANCGAFTADFDYNTLWNADGADGDDLWVRTQIDLTGYQLSTVNWDLGVDNGFTLYVNGVQVAAANAESYTFRWEYGGAINPILLNSGVNYVAVALEDHGGLTAFDMQITADPVPEPASLLLLGTGAAVAAARARRRRGRA